LTLRVETVYDENVGLVLKPLEVTKELDNNIAIFPSDSGYF